MNVIVSNKYQAALGVLDIDVIKSINGEFSPLDLANQFKTFFYNKMIIDITSIKDYENIAVMRELSINLDMTNTILLLDDSTIVNSPAYLSQLVSMGIYNFTKTPNNVKFLLDNPNSYKDVAKYQNLNISQEPNKFNDKLDKPATTGTIGRRVIGIKNLTSHAGATTLTYMLKKHLEDLYRVKAVELNASDFEYLGDNELESLNAVKFDEFLSINNDLEVVLVDLNREDVSLCSEVIYLVEPGILKLNKLIQHDYKVFEKIKNEKIILNRSVLDERSVKDFERESGIKVFFNLVNVDDKLNKDLHVIQLLISLGFTRMSTESDKPSVFGIF